jgi:uncharacterized membrane protein
MEAIEEKNEIKEETVKVQNNIFNIIEIFFVASIIGWIYEMIFYKVTENILENRGFLYGPYVPVYGFGAILIVLLLKRFKKNPLILFVGMALVTGVLELIVGEFMVAVWHKRWWDYTGLFLNIDGQVCLRSVLSFAIGGLGLIYLIEPYINKFNEKINNKNKKTVCIAIIAIMIIDLTLCLAIRHPII